MRKLLLLFVSLLLLAGSLTATLGTAGLRDYELRGYVDATQDQDIPFIQPRLGVNVELLQYEDRDLRRQLNLINESGFRWVRQFAFWDELEPQRGEYNWTAWDQLADALANFPRLELVVVLMNSPAWAREESAQESASAAAPPSDPAAFGEFAAAFANRYGDWIDYYQIWDEPNLYDAWGARDPRPAEYVALLDSAGASIRLADLSATIVSAGLAPTTETGGRNISDIRYLEAMYATGAKGAMDVVAGKPYGFSLSPLDRQVDETTLNFARIIALREVMVKYGDSKKPLWASNYGWNSLPAAWQGDPSIWGAVTESERTQHTLHALDRAHREWPWLGAMFLHHWQPEAKEDDPQWGFSLITQAGEPTPLLLALQAYPLPNVAQNGLYHAVNEYARYTGNWQFGELGADIGRAEPSDSQLEFDFYGADLSMLLREDDYVAFLYPTVNGQPANAAQTDASGKAYIFLRSDSRLSETNLVPVAVDLPVERHSLRMSADRGWDRWAIAGFAVSSGDLSRPYNQQIAIGLIATVLSALALVQSVVTAPWRAWLPPLNRLASGLDATRHLAIAGVTSIFMMLAMLWTWDSPRASLLMRDDVNLLLALASGGLLYVSTNLVVVVALAIGLFVLVYHRLESGLVLTLLWAPFFLFPVELYSYAIPMVEVMILVSTAAALFRFLVWLGRQRQASNSDFPLATTRLISASQGMDIVVAVTAVLGVASLLWAQNPETARTELRVLIIEPLLFYLLIRACRPSKATLIQMFAALVIAGVLVALIGIFQYFSQEGSFYSEVYGFRRLNSVYGSANNAGLLFGRAIPVALAFLLVGQQRRARMLAGLALLCMTPALLLTLSSGALLLGAPAGVIVVFYAAFRRRAVVPLLSMGALGLAAFGLLTRVSERLANVLNFAGGTSFVRLRLWESSIAILRDRPLTGIGLDQFLYKYGGAYIRPDAIWDRDLSHPHNFVFDFWLRLGFLGLVAFAAIQILFWRAILRTLRQARDGDSLICAMALGLAGSMAALLAHGLIDNSVFVIDLAFIFMFQLAACARLAELAAQSR